MEKETTKKREVIVIEAPPEFIEILNELEDKIKKVTWDGLETISKYNLLKILTKKIRASKTI